MFNSNKESAATLPSLEHSHLYQVVFLPML